MQWVLRRKRFCSQRVFTHFQWLTTTPGALGNAVVMTWNAPGTGHAQITAVGIMDQIGKLSHTIIVSMSLQWMQHDCDMWAFLHWWAAATCKCELCRVNFSWPTSTAIELVGACKLSSDHLSHPAMQMIWHPSAHGPDTDFVAKRLTSPLVSR